MSHGDAMGAWRAARVRRGAAVVPVAGLRSHRKLVVSLTNNFIRFIRFGAAVSVAIALGATPAIAAPTSFAGTGGGLIPDSPVCGTPGPSRVIFFNVSGMSAPLSDVRVTLEFDPFHSFAGDVTAILKAPAGGPSVVLFSRIGATTSNSFGSNSTLSGTYTFVDPSVSTVNIWTAASPITIVPPGTCAVTAPGPVTSAPAPTAPLTAAFASLNAAQINGIWTAELTDRCTADYGGVSQASLQLDSAPPPQQFSVNPLQVNFGVVEVNELSLRSFRASAASSNTQTIDVAANTCTISGPDAGQFARLFNNFSLAPGASLQLPMAFRPVSLGTKAATLTCTGVTPAGLPPAPPNCYDVDGDGVMNPLTDGLFILRLQLGVAPAPAANGIAFNLPRNTPLKIAVFMTQICGFHVPD